MTESKSCRTSFFCVPIMLSEGDQKVRNDKDLKGKTEQNPCFLYFNIYGG